MIKNLPDKICSLYRGTPPRVLVRLLAAPFLLSLLDLAVTLYFQPESYWNGDRATVVEGNPIARFAFAIHPLLIIPGLLGWYALVIPLILKTPAWIGLRVHTFLVGGHLVAVAGWLIRYEEHGVIFAAVVWIIAVPFAWVLFAPFGRWWHAPTSVQRLSL
ncbi:MAG: hypothetical protein ACJAVK_000463 [Akkermansiaceae bacterium]|jgi:hypothetical protein